MLPFVSIPLLLSATVIALSDLDSPASKDDGLVAEVENLKLKIARLGEPFSLSVSESVRVLVLNIGSSLIETRSLGLCSFQ